MADVNRGKRPLSPHLTIYRPQLNSAMSIFHRISGCFMMVSAAMMVWWFLAAASGPGYFRFADDLITSWIGGLVLIGSMLAVWYHFFNGIRHLVWDAGRGFDMDKIDKTGYAVLGAAGVMTLLTWVTAY